MLPPELELVASDDGSKLILWGATLNNDNIVCMDYFATRPFERGQIFDVGGFILATPIDFDVESDYAGFFCPGLLAQVKQEAIPIQGILLERYAHVE